MDEDPLALKILVDCSGSMMGMSIEQAQKGLRKILSLLSPHDHVSYSRFGSCVQHLSNVMLPCNERNLHKLAAAIDATKADMGGTKMEKAVLSTVKDISQVSDVPSVMLLITDGDIWQTKA